jgi:competence ComEA-like helix-hairpin-helix protein
MASANRTTDHATIEQWANARGGQPAHVKRTGDDRDPGILRIDFPGYSGQGSLEPLDWDRWFDAFEANGLALIYQDKTASGEQSRFNKLVRRRPEDEAHEAPKHRSGERRKGRTSAVDINSASEEELEALWGVGPATAKKIVEFRQREGRIGSPDDLARIDGIDGATVDNLRRQLNA